VFSVEFRVSCLIDPAGLLRRPADAPKGLALAYPGHRDHGLCSLARCPGSAQVLADRRFADLCRNLQARDPEHQQNRRNRAPGWPTRVRRLLRVAYPAGGW